MRPATLALLLALAAPGARAVDSAEVVQQKFNAKFREFLSQDSQSLLPLPQLEKTEWQNILATRLLQQLYSEPNRFYNSKSYTFTLYRDRESGSYYLDAKGGFWGMDQLIYGPFGDSTLQ